MRQSHLNTHPTVTNQKSVLYKGKEYTVAEVAELLGKCKITIYNYLTGRYKMPIEYYNNGLRYKNEEQIEYIYTRKSTEPKRVICDGKPYNSIQECAEFYGINISTMRSWLNGNRPMRADFKALGLAYI